jgi:hypothetical protein
MSWMEARQAGRIGTSAIICEAAVPIVDSQHTVLEDWHPRYPEQCHEWAEHRAGAPVRRCLE